MEKSEKNIISYAAVVNIIQIIVLSIILCLSIIGMESTNCSSTHIFQCRNIGLVHCKYYVRIGYEDHENKRRSIICIYIAFTDIDPDRYRSGHRLYIKPRSLKLG